MRHARAALFLSLLLAPVAGAAVDLNLGIEAVTGYDDNVFRTTRDAKDDFLFRFTPDVGIELQDSKMGFLLRYRPTYEVFVDHTDANDLTHELRGDFNYALSDKTQLQLRDQFRRLNVLNFPEDDGVEGEDPEVPDNDIRRDKIYTNDTSFTLDHVLSPRWVSQFAATYGFFDSDRKYSADSQAVSARETFTYARDASNRFGFGAGVSVQMYDEISFQPASNTFFYHLFGSWVRHFGESTTVRIQGGPALIQVDQDSARRVIETNTFPFNFVEEDTNVGTLKAKYEGIDPDNLLDNGEDILAGSLVVPDASRCTPGSEPVHFVGPNCVPGLILRNDPFGYPDEDAAIDLILASTREVTVGGSASGSDDLRVTFFGEAEISQRWTPTLESTALYRRSEGTALAQGSATISDLVSFVTVWRPTELWDLSLRGTYQHRESAADLAQTVFIAVPNDTDFATPFPIVELTGTRQVVESSDVIKTKRWSVYGRIARRLTRRTTLSLRASYSDQNTQHSRRNPNNFTDFTVLFGVRYDFDPLRF